MVGFVSSPSVMSVASAATGALCGTVLARVAVTGV